MTSTIPDRFLIVKDNFYTQPELVTQTALQAEFYEPEHSTGYRSTSVYHPKGIKTKLEKILGIKINRWDTDPEQENGIFYHGFSIGSKKEIPGVHSDWPYDDITVLIYLTPGIPLHCGTSLWQHKRTQLVNQPTTHDARRLKTTMTKLIEELEQDSKIRERWIEIDRVGHIYNRMVAYPSGVLHSATQHYGGDLKEGRIYQTFRIGVDWSTFKMNKA